MPFDHQVLMLGPAPSAHGGIASVERLLLAHAPSNVKIQFIPTMVDGSRWVKLTAFVQGVLGARRAARGCRTPIIHVHFASNASLLRKLLIQRAVRDAHQHWVLHAHGGDFNGFFRAQPRPIRAAIVRFFRTANTFVVLSEQWRRFYSQECGVAMDRISVLRNPVALPVRLPPREAETPVRFVFLGSMDERKGAFRVIEAFSVLEPKHRANARLIVAGNGNIDRARRLAAERNVATQVDVRPWLSAEARDELLAAASVYVLPSLNEGLPMGLLEAMSWGLPVIASPVGGIPEVVRHGRDGLLIDPNNIEQISEAMRALIEQPRMRHQMGLSARVAVEPLSIHHYWSSLSEIYERASKGAAS
jgi:glycosyltransferase involved in cell wall biosynthesis